MKTHTTIVPGMTVKVIDPYESPDEWVDFTVISIHRFRVNLLSPSGIKTWARVNEISHPNGDSFENPSTTHPCTLELSARLPPARFANA